ncbi:uncharacterized protein LOC133924567 [Phragmites australis]|uniref:uncharacterized protein LOC133924567 n=1 Tax=Phragmites australis TaxID=29695 RepID=UPI002D795C25|nr:uncharacterized protein LOC133924567 [Phragmites australis]
MGCFLACFGGDGDQRRRRRKSPRQSPARSPPRPNHVGAAVVRKASLAAADVVVKEASPPLRGAKPSTPAAATDAPNEVFGEAAADVVLNEASLPLHGAKASTPPLAVKVADEVVADAGPGKELRELSEQKASPVCSLPLEKQATPPLSPVKCSPVVAGVVSTQDSVKCSPVVAAVVSTPDSELRELSDHGSQSSGKKRVTFDMNATTYENAEASDPDEEPPEVVIYAEDEDENHAQKTVVLPENHRYRNCCDSDDDVGDEYAEDDVYGDDSDEEEEDYVDCKIDLLDEEELSSEENKQESHESLFSLPMSNDQQNDQEVISPVPKSSGTSVEEESPLIRGNNPRDRSKYVFPVLNPVQNMSQWKEAKSLKNQAVLGEKLDKENVNLVPDVGVNQTKMNTSNSSKKEVSVDASLSTWLASSENSTVDKVQSKSPCSISSVSREEKPVLGALTVGDLKQLPDASSPRRSPIHNREGATISATMGSNWSCTKHDTEYCSSGSDLGTNGIPNTTSKYREDKRVNWHSTPFNVRLDRALKKTST